MKYSILIIYSFIHCTSRMQGSCKNIFYVFNQSGLQFIIASIHTYIQTDRQTDTSAVYFES